MKANTDKCHLLVTGNYEASAHINRFEIESSKKEKLLGISTDTRTFFEHQLLITLSKVACPCKNSTLYGL